MRRLQILCLAICLMAVILMGGCVTNSVSSAISRIDEEDVTIRVSGYSAFNKPTLARVLEDATPDAVSACTRYGRTPEYLSYREIYDPSIGLAPRYDYIVLFACNP